MNNRLEQFVGEVEARLTALPPIAREQEVTEIRQHLEALVAAEQELGASEKEATDAAISQFGMASEVGADLNRTGWRQRLKRLPETAVAALSVMSVGLFVPPVSKWCMILGENVLLSDYPSLGHCHPLHLEWYLYNGIYILPATAILVGRDGWRASLRRLFVPESEAGAAIRFVLGLFVAWYAELLIMHWLVWRFAGATHTFMDAWVDGGVYGLDIVPRIVPLLLAYRFVGRRAPHKALVACITGYIAFDAPHLILVVLALFNASLRALVPGELLLRVESLAVLYAAVHLDAWATAWMKRAKETRRRVYA